MLACVRTKFRAHRAQGTQKRRRLRQGATATHQTQGAFFADVVSQLSAPGTHHRSRMPSLALGVVRHFWLYAVLSSLLDQSMLG